MLSRGDKGVTVTQKPKAEAHPKAKPNDSEGRSEAEAEKQVSAWDGLAQLGNMLEHVHEAQNDSGELGGPDEKDYVVMCPRVVRG